MQEQLSLKKVLLSARKTVEIKALTEGWWHLCTNLCGHCSSWGPRLQLDRRYQPETLCSSSDPQLWPLGWAGKCYKADRTLCWGSASGGVQSLYPLTYTPVRNQSHYEVQWRVCLKIKHMQDRSAGLLWDYFTQWGN